MSVGRTAARRAWALSLTLHGATLAGLLALTPRTPPTAGPVGVDTRPADGMAVGVVLFDEPLPSLPEAPEPLPIAQASPPEPLPLTVPVSPPPELNGIQTVVHTEVSPWPTAPTRPAAPTIERPAPSAAPVPPAVQLPPGTATTFFGVPAVGQSVVFVIDRSMSMGLAGRLDRAKREVVASLRRLRPTAKFQVIAYHRTADPLRLRGQQGLLPATPAAVGEAVAALEALSAEGGTNHLQALRAALWLEPDVIYFLTDEDELKLTEVREFTRGNGGRVSVHALCLVAPSPGAETAMQALARGNRGVFQVIK